MKKKKYIIISIITLSVIILYFSISYLFENKKENIVESTNDIDYKVNLDNSDELINWDSLDSTTLNLDNKSVTIDKEGIYTLNGNINNGSVIVNTTGDVKLILDNVTITNNNGPAIIIEEANNTIIELKENTINKLSDGKNYTNTEYDGCIYSKDDLIFQGDGTLEIISNYLDAIVSNDDLKIINGTYIIESNDDGIRGKDSVYIVDGNFTINSNADGIKSTNNTEEDKGYINIENGTFEIKSKEDGIQAETKLIIYNGNFNIKTSDGSSSSNTSKNYYYNKTSYDETSSKGLKSTDNLVIKNAKFIIDSKDDAIHSNNYIGIEDGDINISSGDDGIHADTKIIIDNVNLVINESYEAIEANDITINNGNIEIYALDDGVNISGGNDSSSQGRPGANNFSSNAGTLTINNGSIYVNASGDGLDANGNIIINGGTTYVDGPTNDGNGAIDYDSSFEINGGTFIAVGSSGMAQNFSSSSKQNSIMFYLNDTYNDELIIKDSNNNEIIKYTPKKNYQSILISTSDISIGNTYNLFINDNKISSITSDVVNSSDGFSNMGPVGNQKPQRR